MRCRSHTYQLKRDPAAFPGPPVSEIEKLPLRRPCKSYGVRMRFRDTTSKTMLRPPHSDCASENDCTGRERATPERNASSRKCERGRGTSKQHSISSTSTKHAHAGSRHQSTRGGAKTHTRTNASRPTSRKGAHGGISIVYSRAARLRVARSCSPSPPRATRQEAGAEVAGASNGRGCSPSLRAGAGPGLSAVGGS